MESEKEWYEEEREESDDSDDMCLRKNEGDDVSFEVDEAIEHVKFGKYQIYLIVFIGSIWSTVKRSPALFSID